MPIKKSATKKLLVLEDKEAVELERIKSDAAKLVVIAHRLAVVVDAKSEAEATEFLKQVKMRIDIAEAARTKLVKPLNDHVKMINVGFKETTGPLSEADALVRRGMITYRNSQTFKEAEAKRLAIEEQGRAAVRAGDSDALTRLTDEHEAASIAAPRKVETASGEARFRKITRFEIVDLELLPAGYWMVDEGKINAAVKAGVAIPGVKTWTEEVPMIC